MSATRQAIFCMSRELVDHVLPPGKVVDCIADKLGVEYEWLRTALHLPDNCKITGVSTSLHFYRDEIVVRVECDDFVETMSGNILPQCNPTYTSDENGKPKFLGWGGALRGDKPAEPAKSVPFREFL